MTHEHEKTMLQQISDVAWLVHQGNEKLGILNKNAQERFTYITGKDLVNFKNDHEVEVYFGNSTLFDKQITSAAVKPDSYYIKGYEVDYENPFAIDEKDPAYRTDIPLYTKIEGSDVYYAAGFYCINFGKGWKQSRGPKLATLLKYGYAGPFKTEIEMRQQLKKLNKEKRKNVRA